MRFRPTKTTIEGMSLGLGQSGKSLLRVSLEACVYSNIDFDYSNFEIAGSDVDVDAEPEPTDSTILATVAGLMDQEVVVPCIK